MSFKGFTCVSRISIHAPRGGSDLFCGKIFLVSSNFNPRSPWGERHCSRGVVYRCAGISIHAPRGGSDAKARAGEAEYCRFQSTLPVGGATFSHGCWLSKSRFQSTLPVGGATRAERRVPDRKHDFNPRSPWGERLTVFPGSVSHAAFQSTLPVGGATGYQSRGRGGRKRFQSTLPVGGATSHSKSSGYSFLFQSTLPVGGATKQLLVGAAGDQFQSTLPVGGATEAAEDTVQWMAEFQSTLPVGGATFYRCYHFRDLTFQSTLPVGGATR